MHSTVSLSDLSFNTSISPKEGYVNKSIVFLHKGRIVKVLNNVETKSVNWSKYFPLFKKCINKENLPQGITPFKMRNEEQQWLRGSVVELIQVLHKKIVESNNICTSSVSDEMLDQLGQLSIQLSIPSNDCLDDAEISSFYELLELLSNELPKGNDLQELTKLLTIHVRLQGLSVARESLKQQLYQQLTQLEQPGSCSQYQAQLRLSVGAGLFGLNFIEGNATVKAKFDVLCDEDTGILEIRSAGLNLGLVAGNESIVEGKGYGEAFVGTIYYDESLKAFIDRNVDSIMGALFVAAANKSVGHLLDWKQNRAYVELKQKALSSQHRLSNLLLKQGLPAQVVTSVGKMGKIPLKIKCFSGKVSAGFNLFKRIFKGDISKTVLKMDLAKRQHLVDSLKQDHQRLFRYDQRFYSSSLEDLANLGQQSDKPLVERANQVLDELFVEFQHYSELVQFCDYASAHKNKVSPHTLEQAKATKAAIESQRGAKGRMEYLKTLSISYVALLQLYLADCPDELSETLREQYQSFEEQLKRPLFSVPEGELVDKLSFTTSSQVVRNSYGSKLSFSLPSEHLGLSFDATYFNTKKHPNYYRRGEFLDVSVNLNNQFSMDDVLALIDSEKTAFNSLDTILETSENESGATNSTSSVAQQNIVSQLKQALNQDLNFGLELGAGIECRFKKSAKRHWDLQFIRIKTQSGRAATIPSIGGYLAPTVKMAMSAKASETQTVVRKEWLGSNTLSYILPIYNSLNSTEQAERWQLFTKQHENEFKKMFINVSKVSSSLRGEVDSLLKKINDDELVSKLWSSIEQFKKHSTTNNFQSALDTFNEFLALQKNVYNQLSEKVWQDSQIDT